MNLSLYQIETELSELIALREAVASDGGDTEALAVIDQQIREYIGREIRKVDNIATAVKSLQVASDAAKAESARMRDRAKQFEATAERIKAMALDVMRAHAITKVSTPTNTLRIQKNGGKVPLVIENVGAIPVAYKLTSVTVPSVVWGLAIEKFPALGSFAGTESANEAAIRGTDERVPGPKLGERGEHLRLE